MTSRRHTGGFTIIEMVAYLAVLTVILAGAYAALHEAIQHSSRTRRQSEMIIAVMRAGERWRADVRAATGPISERNGRLVIPLAAGPVTYVVRSNTVLRDGKPLLTQVKTSAMVASRRQELTAWQWEVELLAGKPNPRIRPLFAFISVAGKEPR